MSYTLKVVSTAEQDVHDIVFHYDTPETPELKWRFLDELHLYYQRILDNPHAFSFSTRRTTQRKAVMKRFPYVIYYVILGSVVHVEAILHKRTDV